LYITLGSIAETETHLIISSKIGYIAGNSELFLRLANIKMMVLGLIRSLKGDKK